MNIFELIKQEWPTTVFAWYGDHNFAQTLLAELGWRITAEEPISEDRVLTSLFADISDTLPVTKKTDRLIYRNNSRWNLLIWRNDQGGALLHLADISVPMQVFEFTFANDAATTRAVVGLGTNRRVLESTGGKVDTSLTDAANSSTELAEREWIGTKAKTVGASWKLRLLNSIGLATSKTVHLYADPQLTLTELGAPTGLFDVDAGGSGKLSVIDITDL